MDDLWVIHKHPLASYSDSILVPQRTRMLSVGWQDQIVVWYARPVADEDLIRIVIFSINTGEPIPLNQIYNFLGTIQVGSIVWHIFYHGI